MQLNFLGRKKFEGQLIRYYAYRKIMAVKHGFVTCFLESKEQIWEQLSLAPSGCMLASLADKDRPIHRLIHDRVKNFVR